MNKLKYSLYLSQNLFLGNHMIVYQETKVHLALAYAKQMYMRQKYSQCFEILQSMFSLRGQYPIFIFQYAKYVSKSMQPEYYTSAIGCL